VEAVIQPLVAELFSGPFAESEAAHDREKA